MKKNQSKKRQNQFQFFIYGVIFKFRYNKTKLYSDQNYNLILPYYKEINLDFLRLNFFYRVVSSEKENKMVKRMSDCSNKMLIFKNRHLSESESIQLGFSKLFYVIRQHNGKSFLIEETFKRWHQVKKENQSVLLTMKSLIL